MSENALLSSCEYINRELAAQGFPSPLQLYTDDEDAQESVVKIVNCLYAMLQQRQKDAQYQQETADKLRRLTSENEANSSELTRTRQKLDQAKREVESVQAKLQTQTKSVQEQLKQFNAAKEELKHTKSSLQQVKNQCQVELRKKDRELEKLKDRLAKLNGSSAAKGNRSVGLVCLNPLPKGQDVQPGEHLYDILAANHEEREREYTFENALLRRCLYGLYLDLRRLAEERAGIAVTDVLDMDEEGNFASVDIAQATDLDQVRMALPMEEVSAALETRIKDLILICHERMEVIEAEAQNEAWAEHRDKWIAEHEMVVEKLTEQLEESQQIIAKQRELLGGSLASAVAINHGRGHEDRQALEMERQELEEEKRRLTEKAIRLAQDRNRLQQEREEVEANKRAIMTSKLIQQAPEMPDLAPISRKRVVATRLGSPNGPLSTGVALAQELAAVSGDEPYSHTSPGAIIKTPKKSTPKKSTPNKTPVREPILPDTSEEDVSGIVVEPKKKFGLPSLPNRYRPTFKK